MSILYHIFVLGEFLDETFGPHFPREIIYLIMRMKPKGIKVGLGYGHTIMEVNNKIYIFGSNHDGRLGLGDNLDRWIPTQLSLSNIKKISCGKFHTFALSKNLHTVYAWGNNMYGQMGLGHGNNIDCPRTIIFNEKIKSVYSGYNYAIALTNYGTIYSWGYNGTGQLGFGDNMDRLKPTKHIMSSVEKIYCGGEHNFMLASGQ